jgi:L,D-transpeptidase ErfK/SrfK
MRLTMAAVCLFLVAVTGEVTAQTSPRIVGEVRDISVVANDTLRSIGSRFGVDPVTLATDNGLTPAARLAVGQRIHVDNRHIVPIEVRPGVVVVNVPQRMLFFETGGEVSGVPVAVGRRSWPTPLGAFTVVLKETDPTWDVPASIQEEARRAGRSLPEHVPPGPDNPLGKYWLGLSVGSVGIHGTNAPSSIYQAVTHGCIRVHPDDIARLFPLVPNGAPGELIYAPVLLAQIGDDIYLEAHPDIYRRAPSETLASLRSTALSVGFEHRIDWLAVEAVLQRRAGGARVVTRTQ